MAPERITHPWGERTPYSSGEPWPQRVDTLLTAGLSEDDVERWAQTASVLHSNGDAMRHRRPRRADRRRARPRGDRVNRGRLGPKDLLRLAGERLAPTG